MSFLTKKLLTVFLTGVFIAVFAAPALAGKKGKKGKRKGNRPPATAVPELDPNAVGAGLLLLVGGALVLVGRNRKAPLGAILMRTGLPATTLRTALEKQRASGGKLGDTLLSMGVIDTHQLEFALAVQDERLKERDRIGSILVNAVGIPADVMETALAQQKASGAMLGETLLSMGVVDQAQLDRALELQDYWHDRRQPARAAS